MKRLIRLDHHHRTNAADDHWSRRDYWFQAGSLQTAATECLIRRALTNQE